VPASYFGGCTAPLALWAVKSLLMTVMVVMLAAVDETSCIGHLIGTD
jgi:hypothetical protein